MAIGKVVVVGLGLLFVTGGVATGAAGWVNYQNTQDDLDNAVAVEGTVVNTSIEENEREVDRDDDGVYEGTETSYEPVVRCAYTYERTEYTGASVYPGSERSFGTRAEAANVTGRFAAGESVTVNVNTDDPSSAFLLAEDGSLITLGVAGGAGLLRLVVGVTTIRKGISGGE